MGFYAFSVRARLAPVQLAILTKNEIRQRCKGEHCVDLGESFQTNIYLQNFVSIQPRTSSVQFAERRVRCAWPTRKPSGAYDFAQGVANSAGSCGRAGEARPQGEGEGEEEQFRVTAACCTAGFAARQWIILNSHFRSFRCCKTK